MKRQWTRDELADHWTLGPTELELLANKSGATRLGFAILLKAFTIEGRFPRQKHDVRLWSSSTSPTRSTYLPICTRATSGRAARSNTTALKFASFWASARQPFRTETSL